MVKDVHVYNSSLDPQHKSKPPTMFIYSHVQEVEVFKVKASRVDKLQVELNSQRERLEEANRTSAKLKVSHSHKPLLLYLNILFDFRR